MAKVTVFIGDELARYGFGHGHPFGPDRHDAFVKEFKRRGLDKKVSIRPPVMASEEQILLFHTPDYLNEVKVRSRTGVGYLDYGDTPAFIGIYEAAATVVGTTLAAVDLVMTGGAKRAFVPIAGLHHARRHTASGFCVFNDCGVAIEALRKVHGIRKVAYVDIDAHHSDGVFYEFESDPDLAYADFHEDGRFLYPGTGAIEETGKGIAKNTKLNIPMPPNAGDSLFRKLWDQVEDFIEKAAPEFILLQCGADSMQGDPLTQLGYSSAVHGFTAQRLSQLADKICDGRLVAMGGGGYNRDNIAEAWCAVVEAMAEA
ncbi:MAG: acetoin utilization protein AcuC [Gammaproteobacteria bacterium]|nr:acetoin utilization protein AcuC [Gammaproteobacteria bacterium]